MYIYIVSQKTMHLTFDHNFSKCRRIYRILSLPRSLRNLDSERNYYMVFNLTFTVLLHYLAKF